MCISKNYEKPLKPSISMETTRPSSQKQYEISMQYISIELQTVGDFSILFIGTLVSVLLVVI